jgi:hypothetical protein
MESRRVPQKNAAWQTWGEKKHWETKTKMAGDDVNDLRNMGVRQWTKKAEDRWEWVGIVREAKVKLKKDHIAKEEEEIKRIHQCYTFIYNIIYYNGLVILYIYT